MCIHGSGSAPADVKPMFSQQQLRKKLSSVAESKLLFSSFGLNSDDKVNLRSTSEEFSFATVKQKLT